MKLTDFKRAVNAKIIDATSDIEIPIAEADLSEPMILPSIKTFVDAGSSSRFNANCSCRTVHTDIYFFPSDQYKPRMQIMDMMDRLSYAFLSGIDVDETLHIPLLEDIEFTIEDGVLYAEFEVDVYEPVEDQSNADLMENLYYTEEV